VDIRRYQTTDWPAALKQAFSEAQTVEIPEGLVCENLNTGVFIPPGKTLLVRGVLKAMVVDVWYCRMAVRSSVRRGVCTI
jgi:colanic acid biosynthesis protein WcaM